MELEHIELKLELETSNYLKENVELKPQPLTVTEQYQITEKGFT